MPDNDAPPTGAWRSLLDPPYSLELLAELHADVLEDDLAAQLWPRVRDDRDAATVLAALDGTVAQLKRLGEHPPPVPIPADVASRIDEALVPLRAPQRPVTDLAAVRARRIRRGTYLGTAVVVAAAAVAGVFALGAVVGPNNVAGTPQPGGQAAAAPSVTPLDLGSGALGPQALAAVGRHNLGPLSAQATLAGCLQANGIPPDAQLIGASEVVLDGQRGVLLLLPTGRTAVFTALVVGPECSAQDAATRRRVEIGAR